MGAIQTLGEIVQRLGAAAAPQAAVSPPAQDLSALMLATVAEKTGYPVEMLRLDMKLEADLGIDSIKRVEILSAMREQAPGLPEVDPAEMGAIQTLGEIVQRLGAATTPAAAPATVAAVPPSGPHRYEVRLAPAAASAARKLGPVEVIGDPALAAALAARGVAANKGGVVFVAGDGDEDAIVAEAFRALRDCARRNTPFVAITRLGGRLGVGGCDRPVLAGLYGLVKTAAAEGIDARAVDAACSTDALADEVLRAGPVEVALGPDGRVEPVAVEAPIAPTEGALGTDDVVVVTGGARGVTAACAVALARQSRARFVLLGRSRLDEEPAEVAACPDEGALKRHFARFAGSPAEAGRKAAAVLAAREARSNLRAIEAAGGSATYLAVDVTDPAAVEAALAGVRATLGPITAVVHGAGVLQDRLLKDKTDEQFTAVWDTKVRGLRALLSATRADPLRVIALFSSVAARTGNPGQADYAAANDALNRVAHAEAARREGCLVKSIGWGPWAGGMVTPGLAKQFAARGVELLGIDEGAGAFVAELGRAGAVEVVVGGLLPGARTAELPEPGVVTRRVHARDYPFLRDHTVADLPVFPVVLALEWFAQLAREARPRLQVAAVRDLKVLKGITLRAFDGDGDLFEVRSRAVDGGLAMELRSPDGTVHYRARVELAEKAEKAPDAPGDRAPEPYPHGMDEVYARMLFHGPDFQVLRRVVGVDDRGAEAVLAGTREMAWPDAGWQGDPAAFDGGLQLAVLWTRQFTQAASLPTGIGAWRRYGEPAAGPVRTVLVGRSHSRQRSVSDLHFVDSGGAVFASLDGVEMHTLPGGEYPRIAASAK
jgi:NAD(P)-dependent dehydrogenase (short-subunit alcohol dehydrogenase family)/acyl carrier protein